MTPGQTFRHLGLTATGDTRPDDELLTRFFRERDESAFAELLRRHGPAVLGVCRRSLGNAADADDAFQATFLVLARKAGAIRAPVSLGPWLYGVALRTAKRARAMAAKRRVREAAAAARPAPESRDDGGEVLAAIDAELARLPDRERAAFVACDLNGRSRSEAARELGIPEGTVATRLASARRKLADRLTRRGITPAVGGLAVTVPAALAAGTLSAVREILGGVVAPSAARTLSDEVVMSMSASNLKRGAVCLLLFASVASAALLASPTAAPPPDPQKRKASPDPLPDAEAGRWRAGKVIPLEGERAVSLSVSPDGKMIAVGRVGMFPGRVGAVSVYDAAAENLVKEIPVEVPATFTAVAFNRSGDKIAYTCQHGVRVLDAKTLVDIPTSTFEVRGFDPNGVAWVAAADGTDRLAMTNGTATHIRLNPDEGGGFVIPSLREYRHKPSVLAAAPGGRLLCAANLTAKRPDDDPFEVFAYVIGRLPRQPAVFRGHAARPTHGFVTPDGNRAVTADEHGEVIVWEAGTGELVRRVKFTGRVGDDGQYAHGFIRAMAVSPDGRTAAVVNHIDPRNTVQEVSLLETKSGHVAERFLSRGTAGPDDVYEGVEVKPVLYTEATSVAFFPDGRTLVVAESGTGERPKNSSRGRPLKAKLRVFEFTPK